MKAQSGSRGIALLFFFNPGVRCGVWSTLRVCYFTPGKDQISILGGGMSPKAALEFTEVSCGEIKNSF
jgi:hypothetical protein